MTGDQAKTEYIITEESVTAADCDDPIVYFSIGSPYVDHAEELTPLEKKPEEMSYSETFSWGSNDSGTKELALAILTEVYDKQVALQFHQEFAKRILAQKNARRELSIDVHLGVKRPMEQIMNPTVGRVVVADNFDSDRFHEYTEHSDVKLAVVDAEKLHVWYDGTHYIGVGTADDVSRGDVFYYPNGFSGSESPIVAEVVGFETNDGEYDYVKFDIGERISEGFILGEPMQMGQLPPPTLLEAQESF